MAEKSNEKTDRGSAGQKPVRFTATVRPGHVFMALFFFIAALCLAYIGGVMTGRHTGLARTPAPVPDSLPALENAPQNTEQRILAPEDLAFARALRNLPAPPRGAHGQKPTAQIEVPAPGGEIANKREAAPEAAMAANGDAAESAVAGGAAVLHAPSAPPDAGVLSDYVFQVCALRDEKSVDSLRQMLEGRGLRTRMQREGKLFLVQVLLRGNEERAAEVTAIVQELRLGKPILRSRKPVGLNQ